MENSTASTASGSASAPSTSSPAPASPRVFPHTEALSPAGALHPYWDGGLFDNTPLSKVIKALERTEDPDKRLYVVNLFPKELPLPQNLSEVVTRMTTLAFSNKTRKDLKRAREITRIIQLVQELDRLMEAHPELTRLKQPPGYQTVKRFEAPIEIIEITNQDVGGGAHFSAEPLAKRRRAGYDAAAAAE